MTINERRKTELIEYRINQAFETAEVADLLFSMDKIPSSVNRIYYAVFYCLLAFGIKYGFKTSKHLQLIGWFNKSFIATNSIDANFGRILRDCYEYRRSADYDAFVNFECSDVELLLNEMKSFLDMTKSYLLK